MPNVQITRSLLRFFPDLAPATEGISVPGASVAEVVQELDRQFTGIGGYLLEETGSLRKHVQIFVDGEQVKDRRALTDPVGPETRVFIVQALSGG